MEGPFGIYGDIIPRQLQHISELAGGRAMRPPSEGDSFPARAGAEDAPMERSCCGGSSWAPHRLLLLG